MAANTVVMLSLRNRSTWRLWPVLLSLLWLSACDRYPRDPKDTTERVSGGVMRVGVIHDPPFVDLRSGPQPRGSEVAMLRALAHSLGAEVAWFDGGHDRLLDDLEHYRLDAVIGGLSPDSPWGKHVALTLPYYLHDHRGWLVDRVTALPPGENRWQMQVERFQRSPRGQQAMHGDNVQGAADEATQ